MLSTLISKGFDENYLNYLYSIYKTVFSGNNSWLTIENKYKLKHGIPNTYSIVDTILGEMNANVSANYVETVYEKGDTITRIRTKYNINRTIYQVIDNANEIINLSTSLK